ncbi:MAG TPA: hypothetical protein VMY76_00785 [Gemmatimonadales bacterium]|nr:hypothetical protein [Gemmatimonadales bacterium]
MRYRLPWIQVDADAWVMAEELSGLLPRVDPDKALGMLVRLWRWGLGLGPDDQPPEGVLKHPRALKLLAGALGWRRNAEELGQALADVDAVEITADGLRVRGMSRYHAAWRKNRGTSGKAEQDQNGGAAPTDTHPPGSAPGPGRDQTGTRPGPGANPPGSAPDPARKSETYSNSETEKRARAVAGPLVSKALDEAGAALRSAAEDAGGLVNGQPLGETIETAFRSARRGSGFRWTLKEREALKRLLNEHEPPEILRRWKIGLDARFKTTSSLVDLERCWNDHAQAPPTGTRAATPRDSDWSAPPETHPDGSLKLVPT